MHLVRKVPPRDERVLGLPAQVHDAAAGGGHGRREQGEGQVGREEPQGGHLVDASQVSRRSGHLKVRHHLLRVPASEQRVAGGERVTAAGRDGEGERFQPGGSALGVGGEDDVVAARLEVLSDGDDCLSLPGFSQ